MTTSRFGYNASYFERLTSDVEAAREQMVAEIKALDQFALTDDARSSREEQIRTAFRKVRADASAHAEAAITQGLSRIAEIESKDPLATLLRSDQAGPLWSRARFVREDAEMLPVTEYVRRCRDATGNGAALHLRYLPLALARANGAGEQAMLSQVESELRAKVYASPERERISRAVAAAEKFQRQLATSDYLDATYGEVKSASLQG